MAATLDGAVTVVTGGAAGIGRALTLALAREGADVVVADLDEAGASRVAEEAEALGRRALAAHVDVGERAELEGLVDRCLEWGGRCDVFCSNAGVGVAGPPERVPLEDWEWVLRVNLWPHIWAVRRVLPHMLERGSGHLVHVASSAGVVGFPTLAPYAVSKFGVVGLVESLAAYLDGTGVGATVVCPLGVATDITHRTRMTVEGDEAELRRTRELAHETLQQVGIPPEDVAEATVAGIRDGKLYVFPNPELWDIVGAKWGDPEAWLTNWAQLTRLGAEAGED